MANHAKEITKTIIFWEVKHLKDKKVLQIDLSHVMSLYIL